ncbi:MAG: hemolysin III family protein [Gammaproteobacteria bacterium]|nr:hemolysin III family protein [Gammaproteobacteria bacterium]
MARLIKESTMQTIGEEIANAITHGVGIGLSVIALVVMLGSAALQGGVYRVVSCALFGGALVIMYTASTLYHSFQRPEIKRFFRVLDHSAIYLLIAGTYTPFNLISLHGDWGWSLFGVTWGLAILGVTFKIFFTDRFEALSLTIYLLMGWLAVIAVHPLLQHLSWYGIILLAAGGLCYTLGVVFYVWERLKYSHAIWHLFVLAGSICHFFAIYYYVLPTRL